MKRDDRFGFGFPTAIFIVFLTMKLTGYVDWSWWWVTSPLWLPLLVSFAIVALFGVVVFAAGMFR